MTNTKFDLGPYVGEFPTKTFEAALSLIKKTERARFVQLVNDWQFVPKAGDNETNLLRNAFYRQYQELPFSFAEKLKEYGLSLQETLVRPLPSQTSFNNTVFFSETRFRNMYRNQAAYESCELGTACAQEFLPFLVEMGKITTALVAFIPQTCKQPTTDAIHEARMQYGVTMDTVSVVPYVRRGQDFWSEVWMAKNGEEVAHFVP